MLPASSLQDNPEMAKGDMLVQTNQRVQPKKKENKKPC
jgi:hypothetical protein